MPFGPGRNGMKITMNSLITLTTLFYKIPPHLPLPASGREKIPKRGKIPLFDKEGRGEIL
jgi:hypothetical protein